MTDHGDSPGTARAKALEHQVEERTRELAALLEVSRALSSARDLRTLMSTILEQLKSVIDYSGASVSRIDAGSVVVMDSVGPSGREDDIVGAHLEMEPQKGWWDLIRRGEPVVIDDVTGDSDFAGQFRSLLSDYIDRAGFGYMRSWMAIPLFLQERVVGMLTISKDVPGYFTERQVELALAIARQAAVVAENANLFEQTERRERELAALLDISRILASTLDVGQVLAAIVDNLGAITEHTGASILLFTGDAFEFVEARSVTGVRARAGASIPLSVTPALAEAMLKGETVNIPDIRADDPLAADYRAAINSIGLLDQPPFDVIRSWMAVPLALKDRVLGMLTISWTEPGHFTEEHTRMARAFADQAAVSMENARLYEEASRRARESEALARADAELFSSLDLGTVLKVLVDVTVDILGCDKSMVAIWDAESEVMTLGASRNFQDQSLRRIEELYRRERPGVDNVAVIVTEDVADAHPVELPIVESEGIRSFIQVPIVSRDGLALGFFSVAYVTEHHFDNDEQRLLTALADRAAVAISNAGLHQRVQHAASLEERQRLARELHDSVSQALYGIALGARTARTQLDRNPAQAAEPIEYVLALAQAGMAEMRALIFELRPESLESEGLVAALGKQVAATQARYSIDISTALCEEPEASLQVKEAFYRIAQEAIHNVVKHAQAKDVRVTLSRPATSLVLTVRDDGVGFDPAADHSGHLGLKSMRERAASVGGMLTIRSAPGEGSVVEVRVPC